MLAQALYARLQQAPWANPVLWTVLAIAGVLLLTGVPYPTYFSGAQFIHFLLGPAVVALAWPLWQRRVELRARWAPLLLAALVGGAAAGRLGAGCWAGPSACPPTWCCRWRPSRSPRRWPWALPKRSAASRRWRRCSRC